MRSEGDLVGLAVHDERCVQLPVDRRLDGDQLGHESSRCDGLPEDVLVRHVHARRRPMSVGSPDLRAFTRPFRACGLLPEGRPAARRPVSHFNAGVHDGSR